MLKTEKISLNSRFVQIEGNVVSDMDGEKVMLNIAKGKYYNLGEVGGAIWDIISKPTEVNEIVSTLLTQYEVENKSCESEVVAFLNTLINEGLIRIINED